MAEMQASNKRKVKTDHLKPWMFKPGVSGNPGGKVKGTINLKTRVQNMFLNMSEKQAAEYLKGIDKKAIWEMAEGKPKQDTEIRGSLTISQVLDQLENGQPTQGQELEDK